VVICTGIGLIGGMYQLALFGALIAAVATLVASLKLRRLGRELGRLGAELDARRHSDADVATGDATSD